ncbi:hypothetical protein Ciccas_012254, partial [Cichlidogyrus casuarinus]
LESGQDIESDSIEVKNCLEREIDNCSQRLSETVIKKGNLEVDKWLCIAVLIVLAMLLESGPVLTDCYGLRTGAGGINRDEDNSNKTQIGLVKVTVLFAFSASRLVRQTVQRA